MKATQTETPAGEETTEQSETPALTGPHVEVDRYGQPTGAAFVRCEGCGREVIGADADAIPHAEECAHADAGEEVA